MKSLCLARYMSWRTFSLPSISKGPSTSLPTRTTAWYLPDTPPFVQSAILLGRYTVHKSPVDILHPRYRLELIFFYSVPRGIVRSYVVTRTTLLHNAIHYGFHSIITPITIDPVDFLARTILENIFKHHNSGPPVPRYHPDFLAPV